MSKLASLIFPLTIQLGAPVSFYIQPLVAGTVDAPIPITVQILDQYGNQVNSATHDITLTTSSATALGGVAHIVNGVGVYQLHDTRHESVSIALLDQYNTQLDVTSTQTVAFASGVTVSVVILNPIDGFVGTQIRVVLHALDQFQNIVTQEARSITFVLSGTATGGGVLQFNSGVINTFISNANPETVTLTLANRPSPSVDISSTQDVVFVIKPGWPLFLIFDFN